METFERDGATWRVLRKREDGFLCIQLETKKMVLRIFDDVKPEQSEDVTVDVSGSTQGVQNRFLRRLDIVNQYLNQDPDLRLLESHRGPSLMRSVTSASDAMGFLRAYLQSGEAGLLFYQRKPKPRKVPEYKALPGTNHSDHALPLDDEVRKKMNAAARYYLRNREATVKDAYYWMLNKFFTVNGHLMQRYPSVYAFQYHIRKHTTKKQRDIKRLGYTNAHNNRRVLTGRGRPEPGVTYEIDAQEADISLIDHEGNPIGRPTVYLAIDRGSKKITGYYAGLEVNSFIGLMDLFHSFEQGEEVCVPLSVRLDRGAEMRSVKAMEVFSHLGIQRDLVPPGTGSYKGDIERAFGVLQAYWKPYVEGLITKEKKYKPSLTLRMFRKILGEVVRHYNRTPLKNYVMTPEQITAGVVPTPDNLFSPCRTIPVKKFRYSLLLETEASYDRKGVHLFGLDYYTEDLDEMLYEAGDTKRKMTVRYDPKDVSCIWYADPIVKPIQLTDRYGAFMGLSVNQVKELRKSADRLKIGDVEDELELRRSIRASRRHEKYEVRKNE